jgi:Zn-dependent peptidase ImmA (M78 family)
MHSDIKHLVNLFKGVRDVRAELSKELVPEGETVHSVPQIVTAFEKVYAVKIRRFKVPDLKDNLVRGAYLSFGQDVRILIDKNLPPDWERYITVKELCHLILTDPEYMTEEPVALLEAMIHEETTPLDGEAPLDLVSDMWAKWAAYEILFPHEDREEAAKTLPSNDTAMFALAEKYEVPEHVVDWVLSETHMQTCKAAWGKLQD